MIVKKSIRFVLKSIKKIVFFLIPEKNRLNLSQRLSRFIRTNIDKLQFTPRSALHFTVYMVDHCNISCKTCSVFCPISSEKYLDPVEFEQDIKRISELTKNLNFINFTGGEPLLHPTPEIFFDITRKYFSECGLYLITNGILLHKQSEKFWLSCSRNKVIIRISQYPIKLNYPRIETLGKQYNVCINISPQDIFFKMPLDLQGKQDATYNYKHCFLGNYCTSLRNGKLTTCYLPNHIYKFNEYFNQNLVVTEEDYIDIYKVNNIDEILKSLAKPIPFCRYCKWKEIKHDIGWGVSTKDINEWV